MHTLIPHEHYVKSNNNAEYKSHECSTNLFEGVKLTFSLDHGDGHLEQFVHVYFDVPQLLLSNVLDIVFIKDINLVYNSDSVEVYAFLNLPPDPLRGPPC